MFTIKCLSFQRVPTKTNLLQSLHLKREMALLVRVGQKIKMQKILLPYYFVEITVCCVYYRDNPGLTIRWVFPYLLIDITFDKLNFQFSDKLQTFKQMFSLAEFPLAQQIV